MLPYKAVFVSPVRDCEKYIDKTIEKILNVAKIFEDYYIIFIESDSSDNTAEILNKYRETNSKIISFSLGNLSQKIASRTCRLHTARNFGLKFCKDSKLLEDFDYYIAFDSDEVNHDITPEAVATCFEYPVDTWDAMFANQNTYYDLWTVRVEGWMEDDCWYQVNNRPSYISYEDAINMYVSSKFIKIPKDYGLIEVESAHGGFGIYKTSIIKDAEYYGIHPSQRAEQCEIYGFNKAIKDAEEVRFFINSEMINLYN